MLAGFRSRAVRRNDLPADIDVLWHRVILGTGEATGRFAFKLTVDRTP
jgi:hypothetical protein